MLFLHIYLYGNYCLTVLLQNIANFSAAFVEFFLFPPSNKVRTKNIVMGIVMVFCDSCWVSLLAYATGFELKGIVVVSCHGLTHAK